MSTLILALAFTATHVLAFKIGRVITMVEAMQILEGAQEALTGAEEVIEKLMEERNSNQNRPSSMVD